MDRRLMDYLPVRMQAVWEIKAIMEAEQQMFEQLYIAVLDTQNDQFVLDATENGLSRWEKLLGIEAKETETVPDRQFRILARLNEKLPFTINRLREQLTGLCGEDGYTLELDASTYRLIIRLSVKMAGRLAEVSDLLQRVIPVNLVLDLDRLYNRHSDFTGLTHGKLAKVTHRQMRDEVIDYGA